jgi:hypothetical protein
MPGFIYFIPGRSGASETTIRDVGLATVFGESGPSVRATTGPDGAGGVLCWTKEATRGMSSKEQMDYFAYNQKDQVWTKCNKGKYWLGYWDNNKPGPSDLAREEMFGGHSVVLGDKQQWVIPLARPYGGGTVFPTKLVVDEDGNPVFGNVDDRYADLCERVENLFNVTFWKEEWDIPEPEPMTMAEAWRISIDALGVNYQVTAYECAALGLLNDHNAGHVTSKNAIPGALLDMVTMLDEAKKKDESDSINSGEEA